MLGALSGIDSFSGLGDYAQMHFAGLSDVFSLPNGAPSHDTFQRLFERIPMRRMAARMALSLMGLSALRALGKT